VGRFDVAVIGGGAVGKTSLFKCFSDRQVDPNEPMTIGQRELQHAVGNATIHYMDIAGSDIDASAVARLIHSADCVMFLYDMTSQDSFDWLGSLVPDVIMADHSTWLSMAFVGNKADLCQENPAARQVTAAAAREFADAVGVELVLEVSALTGQGVGIAFAELLHSADEIRFSAPPKTSRGLPPPPWSAAGAASAALDKEAYHQGFAPRKEEVCDSCSVQ
jgi:GTPase SAR1 family protein